MQRYGYIMTSPERSLNLSKAARDAEDDKRRINGLQEVIRLIMESPLKQGAIVELSKDNPIPLKDLKGANVQMQVAMVLSMASGAVGGDVKKAEWLCKYAGYEPIKESKVSVETVNFIDDIPDVPALAPVMTAIADSVKEDDA